MLRCMHLCTASYLNCTGNTDTDAELQVSSISETVASTNPDYEEIDLNLNNEEVELSTNTAYGRVRR